MFKKSKKTETKSKISSFSSNVEKLDAKELKQVNGGTVNYNASKSNTGNITDTGTDLGTGSGNQ